MAERTLKRLRKRGEVEFHPKASSRKGGKPTFKTTKAPTPIGMEKLLEHEGG